MSDTDLIHVLRLTAKTLPYLKTGEERAEQQDITGLINTLETSQAPQQNYRHIFTDAFAFGYAMGLAEADERNKAVPS